MISMKPYCCTFQNENLKPTHHTDLSGHQVTQSVEPVDVGLQITGFTLPEETLKKKKG